MEGVSRIFLSKAAQKESHLYIENRLMEKIGDLGIKNNLKFFNFQCNFFLSGKLSERENTVKKKDNGITDIFDKKVACIFRSFFLKCCT